MKEFATSHKKYLVVVIPIIAILVLRSLLLRKNSDILYYQVSKEDLVDTVSVSGNYEVASNFTMDTPTTGIITELYVENGDEVEAGDKLFYVKATATYDEKAAAYAAYQEAIADLENAKNTLRDKEANLANVYDQVQGHENDESYSQRATRTTAEVSKDNAYQNVEAAKAALAKAKLAYDETRNSTVVSRAGGTVVNLLDKEGDQVDASGPDKTVMSIVNFSGPHIVVAISENYVPRISMGQKVKISFDALKNETFEGKVELLDSVGTTVNGVTTYNARIAIENVNEKIKPGMNAVVTIETLRKDNVVDVPNSSILKENNKSYVYVGKLNSKTEVSTGVIGLTKTEITSGLNGGESIVLNSSSIK